MTPPKGLIARRVALALLLGLGEGAYAIPATSYAQLIGTPSEKQVRFDIAPQDLTAALELYSQQAGTPVFYDSAFSHGRRTQGVSGTYANLEALLILLQGTGLRPVMTETGAVSLTPIIATKQTDAEVTSSGQAADRSDNEARMALDELNVASTPLLNFRSSHDLYAAQVSAQVKRILQRRKALRDSQYKGTLSIWLTPQGEISHSEVHVYSGDLSLDKEVTAALSGIWLRPAPPADLPQPIHLRIAGS